MPNTASIASRAYHIEKVRCFCCIAPSAATGRSLRTLSCGHLDAPAAPPPALAYREGERGGFALPEGSHRTFNLVTIVRPA